MFFYKAWKCWKTCLYSFFSQASLENYRKTVEAALKRLMEKQIIKEAEDGYKLLTLQERQWDQRRQEIGPKPAEKKRILKDKLRDILSEPAIEEITCFNEEKIRLDRVKRTLRAKLMEALSSGTTFFRGVRRDASSLGENLPEVFAKLRGEINPELYPKFEWGAVNLRGKESEEILKAADLEHLSSVFYEPPLNIIVRERGKAVPNLEAEVCKGILGYINRQHSYGERVTGRDLENHFGGLGYAWPLELVQLVLALLLRAGAIEVTYQGRSFREPDPLVYRVFTGPQAFRQASFAPRRMLSAPILVQAARNYEEITGSEVDMEEGAIARAFKSLAEEDLNLLRELIPKMKAQELPGVEALEGFQGKVESVLNMPSDEYVETLYKEGKSYKELRTKVRKLLNALTPQNLELLTRTKRALREKCPELKRRADGKVELYIYL